MEPAKGSVAYAEQRTAVDYGVPSFVVADAAWAKNKGSTPAFSADGQIFFRETLPEKNRGMFAPHEVTHVMRQVRVRPAEIARKVAADMSRDFILTTSTGAQ